LIAVNLVIKRNPIGLYLVLVPLEQSGRFSFAHAPMQLCFKPILLMGAIRLFTFVLLDRLIALRPEILYVVGPANGAGTR
jgi:hypothetical protein